MALVGGHRTYRMHTKLGKLMYERGVRSIDVTMGSGVYPRLMNIYLGGQRKPSPRSIARLCEFLKCEPADIIESEYPWTPEKEAERVASLSNDQQVSA